MTENEQNWAQAENAEVEQAKDAYAEAQAAEKLRQQISQHAAGAVKYGVDRDWANGWLGRLGAPGVTGAAEYRMNIPVTGVYGWRCKATSRAAALARFQEQIDRLKNTGKITADGSYDNVYGLEFVGEPTFYSGPEDPATDAAEALDLDGLKAAIRDMVKEGVVRQGWNLSYARRALAAMELEPLAAASTRTVKVPVSGFTEVSVTVFDGDGDEVVQDATASVLARAGNVYIKPDEIGTVAVVSNEVEDDGEDPF